jgi:protein gp37
MSELSVVEVQRLEALESVIDAGMQTFVHVGNALLEIRDNRLYRNTHRTFEKYCRERWGVNSSRARQLIDAAEVVENLKSVTIVTLLPATETQARPLTSLPSEQQPAVWQRAVETAPNGKITQAHVQAVVDKHREEERTSSDVYMDLRQPEPDDNAAATHNPDVDDEHLAKTQKSQLSRTTNTISVQEWEDADDVQRSSWLALRNSNKFNETNDNIEWASWSWNPVTGCLHDCPYCYARDIATRFYPQKFTPSFLPDRLSAPANTKVPNLSGIDDLELRMAKRNVFVCSMADLFGKWVPTAWIDAVLQQAWDNPQWTFLFLTKFPVRMAEFEFPKNSWIGTTVDKQYAVSRAEKAFTKIRMGGYEGIAWLSCEPMMEKLTFSSLDMFDWVVMGGSSKSTQTPEHKPEFSWTNHLYNQAKALDLPVYMKTNLGIEQSVRVREYPTKA